MPYRDAGGGALFAFDNTERVRGIGDHRIAAIQPERDLAVVSASFRLHFNRPECCCFHVDRQPLDGSHQHMPPVRLAPKNRGEQPDHCGAVDRLSLVVPSAVAGDPHLAVPAMLRIPFVHGRKLPLVDQRLQVGQAQAL